MKLDKQIGSCIWNDDHKVEMTTNGFYCHTCKYRIGFAELKTGCQ